VDATPTAVLLPSDQFDGDDFRPVAISEGTIVVGGYQLDTQQHLPGAAYVYVKPTTGWRSMTETAKLTPSDGQDFDTFGIAVDILDSTIIVGAYQAGTGRPGKAYVFVKPSSGWVSTTETAELTATNEQSDGRFGQAVAVFSNTAVAVVGDQQTYIYSEPTGGWQTTSHPNVDIDSPAAYAIGTPIVASPTSFVVGGFADPANSSLIFAK
jgi:hypothetical protein